MICGIYWIRNTINENCYIGSSCEIEKRWVEHKRTLNKKEHHSVVLQRAWNKYGADKFVFEVILECEKDILLKEEQIFFDIFKPKYNSSKLAVSGGYERTAEIKLKMSNAHKGKKLSEEHKAKIKKAITIEHLRKMQKQSVISRRKGKGWAWSEEAKKKVGLANSPLVYGYKDDVAIYKFDNFKDAAAFLNKSEVTLWRIIKNNKIVKDCIWKKIKRGSEPLSQLINSVLLV